MLKTITDLQMMLSCEHFIVTGSYALAQYGLVPNDKVNDLDIILVKPTQATLELVASLMEKSPAKTKPIQTNVETVTVRIDEDLEIEEVPVKKSFASGGIISKPSLAMVGEPSKLGLIAIFKWNNIKVDIFIKNAEPFAIINGIKYATIPNIVAAKKSCNRVKDWIQLRTISKFFFHKDLWEKFLDTNPKIENKQEDYPF